MKKFILLYLVLGYSYSVWSQENQVRGLVDRMFQSMEQKDTAALRKCFTPGVQFTTFSYDSKGNSRAKGVYLNDFLRQVSLIGEYDVEEKLTGWQCFIDDGMASVWAPYEFYFDKKFTHCGVNSIQVIKVQNEWRINQITDTRRKQDCIDVNKTKQEIDSLVNQWHHDAAIADASAYFGRIAEDGVYIGTDAGERWTKNEFETWSKKYFDSKSTWDFKPVSRNITIAPGGQMAWFDELLDTWMGTCRSTGIMMLKDDEWKIIHYQLSVAVPNDKIGEYRKLIGKI